VGGLLRDAKVERAMEEEGPTISSHKEGIVPGPHISTEPLRLTVTPTVPGYDPMDPDRGAGGAPGRAGPGREKNQEELIEEYLQSDVSLSDRQRHVKHMLERASEHVQKARTYRGLKNKNMTRMSYQRALKYFEEIVALDPNNAEGRRGRQECLSRLSS